MRFALESENVSVLFPGLYRVQNGEGNAYVAGELRLTDESGLYIDSYSIKIESTDLYPFRFPHVFETGDRIPINVDWHVFQDGHCCIKSIPEEILLCKNGITLPWFIETQVKPYFFNQKYREIHGFFLRERAHGQRGIIEFFEETFGTTNLNEVIYGLQLVKSRNEPNRVSHCFCGSGLKYRKCHRTAYRLMSQFTNEELDYFIGLAKQSIKF